MVFLFLNLELNRTFLFLFDPLRLPVLSILWVGMCGFLLREYLAGRNKLLLHFLGVFILLVLGKLFFVDLPRWGAGGLLLYGGEYSFLQAGMRVIDFGAVIGFLLFEFWLLTGDLEARQHRDFCGPAALVLMFIFLTLEVNTFLASFADGSQSGGVSILWSLFALGCLLGGIWNDLPALRYVALGLFAVVGWKVLFSDLALLDALYRIVAFMVLGVLVLCGSFIYLKYRSAFADRSAPSEGTKS
jgi:uncharacterized membrane protein